MWIFRHCKLMIPGAMIIVLGCGHIVKLHYFFVEDLNGKSQRINAVVRNVHVCTPCDIKQSMYADY